MDEPKEQPSNFPPGDPNPPKPTKDIPFPDDESGA
jgi:hypothetical protein